MTERIERDGPAEDFYDSAGPTNLPGEHTGEQRARSGTYDLPQAPALLVGPDGFVADATAEASVLAGAGSPHELLGCARGELLHERDEHTLLRRRDGGERSVRVTSWPAPDPAFDVLLLVDVTDLAGTVDSLRENCRRLHEVHRVAHLGSWEFDPQTGTTEWSDGHHEILGLRPGEVVPGAPALLELVHPDDRATVHRCWAEHRESGEPVALEYRVRRPDGEIRQVRGAAEAQHDGSGEIARVTGYLIDVTEQRRAQRDLDEERSRLVDAQRIARIGSWIFYPATGELHRSAMLREFYAEAGLEIDRVDFLGGMHAEDRPQVIEFYERLLAATDDRTYEVEARSWDGQRVYMCTGRAEHDAAGKVERLQGTVQDVTEQHALERKLREEQRKLDDAQRAARLGTWEWDPRTGRTRLSGMLHEIVGRPFEAQTTYEGYLAQVHPEDRDWVDEVWRQLANEHAPIDCEHRYVRPDDGAVRVLRLHGAPVHRGDDRTVLVGTAQDVTEQRAAVTRMERSSQRFTDLVSVTPVGIGLFDQSERLVDANNALCELLGYRLEELRGMRSEQMTHPDERASGLQAAGPHQEEPHGDTHRVPQRILIRSDGAPVYCELHIALSVQDDGTRFWLVVFQDVTERRRSAEALRHQATHDELTGLPNRAAVKESLAELLGSGDSGRVLVLFCDIDNFKRVNDSLGHDAGDELLVALARRLEGGLPEGCLAARISGDEFVVICSDIGAVGGVDALATKVSSLLRTAVPVHGQLIRVSASIGAAMPSGGERASGEDMLRFADAAMFEAKRRGAGRVALASAALMASADRQLHLEGQLREAISRNELTLHYQPVLGPDGAIVTAEALVRWPHPERGLLAPDVFLPVAEQGDLLRELDRWVLRTALQEAASWPCPNDRPVAVAVNLAGLVPGDHDFVDAVNSAVADSGIDWNRVVLELVETSLVDLPSRTRHAMGELVDRGVRFAVDDFGTGYSSLARLKDLPAQIIKVDRRFVSGVGSDPSDFAVARAVVDMARAMGRSCVAEGVETATQFHVLRGVGVDAYQGWLFSRPVPPREFRGVLELGPLKVPRTN